jgi:hypothetical protein
MKALLLIPAFFIAASAAASDSTCGTLEASMYQGKLELSLADTTSYANRQQNFAILNAEAFDWTAGSCLCVSGPTAYDPAYGKDYLYQQITVTKVDSVDPTGKDCQAKLPR